MRLIAMGVLVGVVVCLIGLLVQVDGITSAAPLSQATAYPGPGTPGPTITPVVTTPGPISHYLYIPLFAKASQYAPAAPRVTVEPLREGGYRVRWTAIANADTYRVYESRAPTMADAHLVATIGAGGAPRYDFAPRPAGRFYYRVEAHNQVGSAASAVYALTIPAAPRLTLEEVSGGGYGLGWGALAGPSEYRLFESTTPTMLAPTVVEVGASPVTARYFPPRPRGIYYYRLVVILAEVAVVSDVLAVPVPRPGLWGNVTYNGRPIEGVLVQLRRCSLGGGVCDNRTTLETVTSQSDGSYSFTRLDRLDATTAYYIYFDNPTRRTSYLNFWRGRNVFAYNGRDTIEASSFDIANIFLEEPAHNAMLPNPVGFRWQRRSVANDNYCVMFMNSQLTPLIPCLRLGNIDYARLDVQGVLNFNTPYNWTTWVDIEGQGYGEAFYYRTVTVLPTTGFLKDALRLLPLWAGMDIQPVERESVGPWGEP